MNLNNKMAINNLYRFDNAQKERINIEILEKTS